MMPSRNVPVRWGQFLKNMVIGADAEVVWRKKAFVLLGGMFLFAYECGLDSKLRFPHFYHTLEESASCLALYSFCAVLTLSLLLSRGKCCFL